MVAGWPVVAHYLPHPTLHLTPTPHHPLADAQKSGRERYVFFSFPHIAIDSDGKVGQMMRPGRDQQSCACGALLKALGEFKAEGYQCNCKVPGVHDPLDPEYSILKQRLARRLRYERADVATLDLVNLTNVAERTITNVSAWPRSSPCPAAAQPSLITLPPGLDPAFCPWPVLVLNPLAPLHPTTPPSFQSAGPRVHD
jgi:hypothetical protein